MCGNEFLEIPAAAVPARYKGDFTGSHQDLRGLSAVKALKFINWHVLFLLLTSLLPHPIHRPGEAFRPRNP